MSQISDFQDLSYLSQPEPCSAVGAAPEAFDLEAQHAAAVAAHEQARQEASQRPASPNYVFKFGFKHFGRTYIEVAENDPGQYFWVLQRPIPVCTSTPFYQLGQ